MHPEYSTLEFPTTVSDTARVTSGHSTLSSRAKAVTVTLLAWLLAYHPALAMGLGRLVLRLWPAFRRA